VKMGSTETGVHIDTRLIRFRQKYWQMVQLAHGWDCNLFFNQGCQELIEDLKRFMSSGTVTPEQVGLLIMMLKGLVGSQERWLLREAAIIEAAGAVRH